MGPRGPRDRFIRVLMEKTILEAEIPISGAYREALRVAEIRSGRGEYVFRDASGRRYSASRIRRAFLLAKKLAGICRRRGHGRRRIDARRNPPLTQTGGA